MANVPVNHAMVWCLRGCHTISQLEMDAKHVVFQISPILSISYVLPSPSIVVNLWIIREPRSDPLGKTQNHKIMYEPF
jgi:hypothetical protein